MLRSISTFDAFSVDCIFYGGSSTHLAANIARKLSERPFLSQSTSYRKAGMTYDGNCVREMQ